MKPAMPTRRSSDVDCSWDSMSANSPRVGSRNNSRPALSCARQEATPCLGEGTAPAWLARTAVRHVPGSHSQTRVPPCGMVLPTSLLQ